MMVSLPILYVTVWGFSFFPFLLRLAHGSVPSQLVQLVHVAQGNVVGRVQPVGLLQGVARFPVLLGVQVQQG